MITKAGLESLEGWLAQADPTEPPDDLITRVTVLLMTAAPADGKATLDRYMAEIRTFAADVPPPASPFQAACSALQKGIYDHTVAWLQDAQRSASLLDGTPNVRERPEAGDR